MIDSRRSNCNGPESGHIRSKPTSNLAAARGQETGFRLIGHDLARFIPLVEIKITRTVDSNRIATDLECVCDDMAKVNEALWMSR